MLNILSSLFRQKNTEERESGGERTPRNNKPTETTVQKTNDALKSSDNFIEDFSVDVYKNNPIFKDFLNYNDANHSFLENMKTKLKKKMWSQLTEEERCFYLSNKTSYYQSVVKAKLSQKNKLDKTIEKKRQNIERLKQEIEEKKKYIEEYREQKFHVNAEDVVDRRHQIELIDRQIKDLEDKIMMLDERIEECNKMLNNYESPSNTLPIVDIIRGLKEEKKRLKCEIENKHKKIKDLEEKIHYYRESLQVLEMKYK